jgi:hypothetical protein
VAYEDKSIATTLKRSVMRQLAVSFERAKIAAFEIFRTAIAADVAQQNVNRDERTVVIMSSLREAPSGPDSVELDTSQLWRRRSRREKIPALIAINSRGQVEDFLANVREHPCKIAISVEIGSAPVPPPLY